MVVDGSVFNTDGFPIVVANERGLIDNNATVKFQNFNAKVDYSPTDRVQAFFRTGYFSEDRGNGKIREVNDTRWTSVERRRRGSGCRTRASCRRASSRRFRELPQQLPRRDSAVSDGAPRSIVRLTIDQNVPTKASAASCSGRRRLARSSTSAPAPTGAGWTATARKMRYNAAPGPVVPPVHERGSGAAARLRRHAAQRRRLRPGHPDAAAEADADAERPRRSLAQLRRRTTSRPTCPPGTPTANNRPSLPDKDDTVVSPRVAALYHVTDRVNVWGDVELRLPRADAERAVSPVPRRHRAHAAPNNRARPRAADGRRSRRQRRAAARSSPWRTTWFDNRVKNPVSNVTIAVTPAQTHAAAAEPRPDAHLGHPDRRRIPRRPVVAASAAAISTTRPRSRSSPRTRRSSATSCRRCRSTAGRCRSSTRIRGTSTVAFGAAVPRPAVRRRPERAASVPGLTAAGAAEVRAGRLHGVARRSHRNLDVFFGVQNLFDEEYFVGTLPTTIGSPRLINGGVARAILRPPDAVGVGRRSYGVTP